MVWVRRQACPCFVVKVKVSYPCGLSAFGAPRQEADMERIRDEVDETKLNMAKVVHSRREFEDLCPPEF